MKLHHLIPSYHTMHDMQQNATNILPTQNRTNDVFHAKYFSVIAFKNGCFETSNS